MGWNVRLCSVWVERMRVKFELLQAEQSKHQSVEECLCEFYLPTTLAMRACGAWLLTNFRATLLLKYRGHRLQVLGITGQFTQLRYPWNSASGDLK